MRWKLSQDRLLSLMSYNEDSGLFTRKVTRGGRRAGSIAGSVDSDGYRVARVDGYLFYEHHLAWLACYGVMPKEIDHINGDKSDNRIKNLRVATRGLNMGNTIRKSKKGLQGVRLDERSGRYQARFTFDGKTRHLGMYSTETEAFEAYVRAKRTVDPMCRVALGAGGEP